MGLPVVLGYFCGLILRGGRSAPQSGQEVASGMNFFVGEQRCSSVAKTPAGSLFGAFRVVGLHTVRSRRRVMTSSPYRGIRLPGLQLRLFPADG